VKTARTENKKPSGKSGKAELGAVLSTPVIYNMIAGIISWVQLFQG